MLSPSRLSMLCAIGLVHFEELSLNVEEIRHLIETTLTQYLALL